MEDDPRTTCGAGAYVRDVLGVWRYAWGEPVPGATDVLAGERGPRPVSAASETGPPRWVTEGWLPLDLAPATGDRPDLVGMRAPETAGSRLLSREDLGLLAAITSAPLPSPQVVLPSGQPRWTWPVVRRWLAERSQSSDRHSV
jgi:hypothetical protein